jgi:hypothetical protein
VALPVHVPVFRRHHDGGHHHETGLLVNFCHFNSIDAL